MGTDESSRGVPGLPLPLSTFVGRERELIEIPRVLATTRLLTLIGTGGVGKTRLAFEVARRASTGFGDGARLSRRRLGFATGACAAYARS